MKFLKLKPYALAGALSASLAYTPISSASYMDNVFNGLLTGTGSGVYKDSLSTTFYGGSLRYRSQIMTMGPVMSISPPKIKGGCGGFDLTSGSLSFISGEKLAGFIKSLASNAGNLLVYAFLMALKSQCQFCENTLTWLENIQNAVNQSNLNSCQAAKNLITGTFEGGVKNTSNFLSGVVTAVKSHEGLSLPEMLGHGGLQKEAETGKEGFLKEMMRHISPEEVAEVIGGNILFESMLKQDVASWFPGADDRDEFIHLMLNIIGTQIAGYSIVGSDGKGVACAPSSSNPQCKLKYIPVKPTLDFKDLIEGVEPTHSVKVCDGSLSSSAYDGCLIMNNKKLTASPLKNFTGFEQKFDEVFGYGKDGTGLLYKMSALNISAEEAELTSDEKLIIESLSKHTTLVSMLSNLSANKAVMEKYYRDNRKSIAVEISRILLESVLKAVSSIVEASDIPVKKDVLETFENRKKELVKEMDGYRQKTGLPRQTFAEIVHAKEVATGK